MVSLEYIAFEHNNAAAELVKLAYDTPPLAFVHSYGCQQNVNDGERIKGVLMDIGYGLCDKPEDADLFSFRPLRAPTLPKTRCSACSRTAQVLKRA